MTSIFQRAAGVFSSTLSQARLLEETFKAEMLAGEARANHFQELVARIGKHLR
jgi:hypothetical protein